MKGRSVRFFIDLRGGTASVMRIRRVAMLAPASQRLTPNPDERGWWVELRDFDGRTVYRHAVEQPWPGDLEAPAADGERLSRVASPGPPGVFSVVVPDIETARAVHVYNAQQRHPSPESAPELISFEIDPDAAEDY